MANIYCKMLWSDTALNGEAKASRFKGVMQVNSGHEYDACGAHQQNGVEPNQDRFGFERAD